MPWFPEFVSAVELARRQARTTGQHDPVGQYFTALNNGDVHLLERAWPGEVTVYDPKAGEVRGHRHLRRFVRQNKDFLAERGAQARTVAATCVPGRAVVELLVHLTVDGADYAWPVAVVAVVSPDDLSVVFRTYCSRWPVDGRRYLRPPILDPGPVSVGDVVGRHLAALDAGDVDGIVQTFAPDGYLREAVGANPTHTGAGALRSFYQSQFAAGGGVELEHCAVTDDGTRCALEYNCLRWGGRSLTPQAGLVVYDRGPNRLLAAARIYNDIDPPFDGTGERSRTALKIDRPEEDPGERRLFETIRTTYALALEPEQLAMVRQLRNHLASISFEERTELIDDIQRAIGQNMEDETAEF